MFFPFSANLTEFLLEKSRVVCRGEGELNFHIFYWMFSGISPEEANLYHLTDISTHRFVTSYFTTLVWYVSVTSTYSSVMYFLTTEMCNVLSQHAGL